MLKASKNILKTIFFGLLFLKVGVIGYYVLTIEPQEKAFFVASAIAKEESDKTTEETILEVKPNPVDEFLESIKQRRLLQIQKREEALKEHSRQMNTEEARLKKVQEDLKNLLTELKSLQTQIGRTLDKKEKMSQEQLARLAKVYEETPAEQAGPMISKLEPGMAAQILIRMNPRKAGKIWGQVNPEKGVKISEELLKLK